MNTRWLCATALGLLLLFSPVLLAGCGGGGGAGPGAGAGAGENVIVLFPPGYSTTSAQTLTVRGVIENPSQILGLEIDGAVASSNDGFATWTAVVPLTPGENSLDVSVNTTTGSRVAASVAVRREVPFPGSVGHAAYDVGAGVAYLLGNGDDLVAVDLQTGARTLILANAPQGYMAVDGSAGKLYVTTANGDTDQFVVIDTATGQASILSQDGDGMGPDVPGNAERIAVDPVAGLLLATVRVGGVAGDEFYGIDLQTGARSVIATIGAGRSITDIVAAPGSGAAFVFERSARSIWTVTLATGLASERTTDLASFGNDNARMAIDVAGARAFINRFTGLDVVDLTTGVSSSFSLDADHALELAIGRTLASLQFDAPNQRLLPVGRSTKRLIAVDAATAARTVVHEGGFGAGVLYEPTGAAVVDANRILISDERRERIDSSQLGTAVRNEFSGPSVGVGPLLGGPAAVAVDGSNGTVYVLDSETSIVDVDLLTGARTVISSAAVGVGTLIDTWTDLVCTPSGDLYALDDEEYWIVRVDPLTGDRTTLSGGGIGAGPEITGAAGLAYNTVDAMLYLSENNRIFRVDPVTGDRSIILDGATALPGTPIRIQDLFVSPDGTALYFAELRTDSVYRVDLTTNAITVAHNGQTTAGLPLLNPSRDLVGVGTSGVALSLDTSYDGVVAVDLVTGEAVLMAR